MVVCLLCSISECSDTLVIDVEDTPSMGIDMRAYQPNEQWTIVNTQLERTTRFCASVLKFHLRMRRKPFFYVFNIVLPIMILSVTTLSVFMLPADCNEKVGLAVSILLAFIVFQTVVADVIPRTPDTPLIG